MDAYVNFNALLQVLVASLLGGAGLVATFAVGLVGTSAAGAEGHSAPRRVAGLSLAAAAFLLVALGVVVGIYTMIHKPA